MEEKLACMYKRETGIQGLDTYYIAYDATDSDNQSNGV